MYSTIGNDITFFSFEAKNSHLIDVEKKKPLCGVKNKKTVPAEASKVAAPRQVKKKTLKPHLFPLIKLSALVLFAGIVHYFGNCRLDFLLLFFISLYPPLGIVGVFLFGQSINKPKSTVRVAIRIPRNYTATSRA